MSLQIKDIKNIGKCKKVGIGHYTYIGTNFNIDVIKGYDSWYADADTFVTKGNIPSEFIEDVTYFFKWGTKGDVVWYQLKTNDHKISELNSINN